MQQKANCAETFIELKSVTESRIMCTREYGHLASSTASMGHARQGFQIRVMVGRRSRSGRPGISYTNAARIKNASQKDPTKPLILAIADPRIPFSTPGKALREELGMFSYKTSFLQQF